MNRSVVRLIFTYCAAGPLPSGWEDHSPGLTGRSRQLAFGCGAGVAGTDGACWGGGGGACRDGATQDARASSRAVTGMERRMANSMAHSRSEEHTSELQSLMRISYAVFCLNKKKEQHAHTHSQPNLARK